jgi:hypothetical protein
MARKPFHGPSWIGSSLGSGGEKPSPNDPETEPFANSDGNASYRRSVRTGAFLGPLTRTFGQ